MEEMGLLSSRDFPPSKVYSISTSAEKDIYETVKEVCANIDEIPEKKRPEIILYFLQKLFRRPVFQEEMVRTGFEGDIETFAVKVSNEERLEIKKQLTRKGYKLPLKDPAFIIQDKTYDNEFDVIIQHMLLQKFKAMNLSVDSKQTKLGI
jgi:hypothetical protein